MGKDNQQTDTSSQQHGPLELPLGALQEPSSDDFSEHSECDRDGGKPRIYKN